VPVIVEKEAAVGGQERTSIGIRALRGFFLLARLAKLGTTSRCESGRGKSQVAS
jgi:hypothetical protein